MNSINSPQQKKAKMQLLQSVKNLGSFLSHSANYWKDTFDKNICSCSRPEIEEPIIEREIEGKKDLFKVVGNTKTSKKLKTSELIYQKEWSKKESELLINNYYCKNLKNWKKLSEIIETKSPQQCCYRIKRIEDKAKINSFTKQDDLDIMRYVEIYGKDWKKIAGCMPCFNANLIEDRYNSKLDPYLKRTKFSSEEDEKILLLYEKYGNNWKEIASNFIDRNSNMIKNRFYSVLKKKLPHSYNSCSSSYVDTHSIINSSLLNSIEENALEYMVNMPNDPNEFMFSLNEYTKNFNDNDNKNYNKNNDNSSNDINISSNQNHNDLNIEMKDNIMFDHDSNNSGGIIFQEDNNNNAIKMDSFNEIYQKVFHNDIERIDKDMEMKDSTNHFSHLNNNDTLSINTNTIPNAEKKSKGCNSSIITTHKITEIDDLFIESKKLEEILSKIDQEEVINEYESGSVFPSIENENDKQQFNQLLIKQEKLAKSKEMLYVQLKKQQSEYIQLKNIYPNDTSNNVDIPHLLRQVLMEINDILLQLISVGKMRIILKKQIYDFFKEKNSNSKENAYNNMNHMTQAGK